jgi:hypothetical protein
LDKGEIVFEFNSQMTLKDNQNNYYNYLNAYDKLRSSDLQSILEEAEKDKIFT